MIFLIILAILYDVYLKRRKGEENQQVKDEKGNLAKGGRDDQAIDENKLIVDLHDIVRNFIIIFTGLMWPLILFYFH